MWGQTLVEANSIQNFNFGFSTYKSDILLHLSQWQYWWWFWFTLLWTLYLFIVLTMVQRRNYQFNPVINTSIRGHGKWGDFLVALIPLSWCGNILINSNFILRMIEWQNESSLFTIRVQGKQWYWVYKYDATAAQAILTAPKNVGHNNWFIRVAGESLCADTYYQALQLGTQLEFNQLYQTMLEDKNLTKTSLTQNLTTSQPIFNKTSLNNSSISSNYLMHNTHHSTHKGKNVILQLWGKYSLKSLQNSDYLTNNQKILLLNNGIALKIKKIGKLVKHQWALTDTFSMPITAKSYQMRYDNLLLNSFDYFIGNSCSAPRLFNSTLTPTAKFIRVFEIFKGSTLNKNHKRIIYSGEVNFLTSSLFLQSIVSMPKISKNTAHFDYQPLEDTQDFSANKVEVVSKQPLKILKGILNIHNLDLIKTPEKLLTTNILFIPRYETNLDSTSLKPDHGELLWGFKQKKYKRLQKFIYSNPVKYDPKTFSTAVDKNDKVSPLLHSNRLTYFNGGVGAADNPYYYQSSIKFNRHKSELVPVTLARRLLRTKRTLVLPAHTNITVITNSYDVVHSWFIPGLGLKLDCVPGRSTHHTFYIDNIGFYYGQCAEICGRYHHHMPIRICALPFEQFLVWWQKRGLKRMHRVRMIRNNNTLNSEKIKFRYQW